MVENSQVQKRKRGVILSSQGWQRLKVAEQQAADRNNGGRSYTLEQLGEQTGLSPNTITKVRRRRLAVDRQTLEFYFNALNLTLNSDDYISVDSDIHSELQLLKPLLGQVPLESSFYIERAPIDGLGAEEVLQSGALVRIKGARQFGKTSLMVRVLAAAQEKGLYGIVINLQLADALVFQDLNRFLRWFCAVATRNLQFPSAIDDYWNDIFGSSYNCTDYFENYLLPKLDAPLVLAIDELDAVFNYLNIATDFLGMLRAWYEKARYGSSSSSIWQQLRLVIVHSTDIYVPPNISQSPLNVGLLLDLPSFTAAQVQDLSQRYGLEKEVSLQLFELLGGIPVLTQIALYHLVRREMAPNQLMQPTVLANSLFSSHLRYRLVYLQQHPDLIEALKQVIMATEPVELNPLQAFRLQSLGLVKLTNLKATPACKLYRDYFKKVLPSLS